MNDFASLESCAELTPAHAALAASSSVGIRALLTRMAAIAKPGQGCPKVLMAVARLVGQDWLDGELRIELSGDDSVTTMIVMCDFGVGIRERLLPSLRFAVPIDEFGRAVELAPKMVHPLRISEHEGLIILTQAPEGEAEESTPVPTLTKDDLGLEVPPAAVALSPELDDPFADELTLDGPAHEGRMRSAPARAAKTTARDPATPDADVHTRPTVERMVAIDAAAIAALNRRDPRREEE